MKLTPEQINRIKGTNQIYADDGFKSPIDAAFVQRTHIALLLDHIESQDERIRGIRNEITNADHGDFSKLVADLLYILDGGRLT